MHPLQVKIAALGRQSRRLLWGYGLGWLATAVLAAVVLLGTADYLIHFEDRGIRVMATLAVVGAAVWGLVRRVRPAVSRRLSDIELAQKVEQRFPVLNDRLASSVEFLKQPEDAPQAGSAALRRAVIVDTTSAVERLDFNQVLDRRPAKRALAAAAAVGIVAIGLALAEPSGARIALARLFKPFGSDVWPQTYHLVFRNPVQRLASGKAFEVELADRDGRQLPDEVRIHYRFDDDPAPSEEVELMQRLNLVMVARRDGVRRPFSYRAEGGDDRSMEWIRLDIVELPRVDTLKIKLTPPEYTGWPVETVDRQIHALRGTRLELAGAASKPLAAAAFHQEGHEPVSAKLSEDGYSFTVPADPARPLVLEQSGAYWFDLRDREDLSGGEDDRWEIRAVADVAPSVAIEQPASTVFVTADATVPLRILAKDDLAVRSVALSFSRSDQSDKGDTRTELWKRPDVVAPAKTGGVSSGVLGDSRLVEERWELKPLGLKPGVQINFVASAVDYAGQTGQSQARRLTIITPQELEDRIAQRQGVILSELARVLKMQQEARSQVTSLEIQMREVGKLGKQDIDHAQGAELNQRQVARTLTSPAEGLPAQIRDLLGDLASNQVDSPDVQRRMSNVLSEIERLGKEDLNVIERELTAAIKGATAALPPGSEPKPAASDKAANDENSKPITKNLAAAGEHQDNVVRSLEGLLGELSQWDNYRRFARDIGQIRRDQDDIAERTKAVGSKTLTRDLKDLDAQQQADLKKLGGAQQDLARRMDKIQQQMESMEMDLRESDPLSAATIADALHQARRQAVGGQMRESAGQVEKNQIGQALEQQGKTTRDLQELLDILANRRENELGRLVQKLKESEAELAGLKRQQAGLKKKMDDAKQIADPAERKRELERLSREQRELQKEAQRLGRKLERLQAEKAGRTAGNAAAKMSRAGQAGEQGEAGEAGEEAEQALKDLEDAQQQLAERRKQAEADLAREQLARLKDGMKGLVERQRKVLEETQRLDKLRDAGGQLTRAQDQSVLDAARDQKSVQAENRALAEKIAAAEVFKLALDTADKSMARAASLLDRLDTGRATQAAEAAALARLQQLVDAMKDDKKEGKQGGEQGGGSGGGKQGGSQDGIRALAEIKLLKLMQEDINSRFQTLTDPDNQASDDERQQDLGQLSEEQGKLAELALRLSKPQDEKPEDNPAKLPDLRLDDKLKDAEGAKP